MKVIKRLFAALLALAAATAFAAVDVNNASVADLDSIKGLGRWHQPHDGNTLDEQLASFKRQSGILVAVHPAGSFCKC